MAKYVLVNQVNIGGAVNLPGSQVDTDVESLSPFLLAGALLWPVGNATVDAAAAKATADRRNRGINEAAMADIMKAAIDSVQLQSLGSSAWRALSTWEINPVTGNDTNDGQTQATALKTWAKFAERIGVDDFPAIPGSPSTVISPIQLFTIYVRGGNLPVTDKIRLRGTTPPNSLIAVVGTMTTVDSGTMSAVTPQVRSTNTPWDMTAAPGIAAHLGRRVRNTTVGANLNQVAWIAKDLTGDKVRLSTMNNPNLPDPPDRMFQTAVTPGVFTAGDTYAVEDGTQAYVEMIDIASSFNGQATIPMVGFANFDFQRDGTNVFGAITTPRGQIETQYKACRFRGQMITSSSIQRTFATNCGFDIGANIIAGAVQLNGGLSRGQIAVRRGAFAGPRADFMMQGADFSLFDSVSAQVNGMAVFDSPTAGVQISTSINAGASANVQVEGPLWGSGNATVGVDIFADNTLRYLTGQLANITITGAVAEFRLAGATTHRSWDEGAGTWGAATPNTWAGILNDNAWNVGRGAKVVKFN